MFQENIGQEVDQTNGKIFYSCSFDKDLFNRRSVSGRWHLTDMSEWCHRLATDECLQQEFLKKLLALRFKNSKIYGL